MRERNVQLRGRILYLTEDPAFVRDQLAGTDPAWDPTNARIHLLLLRRNTR
jgi:hypothetical protein